MPDLGLTKPADTYAYLLQISQSLTSVLKTIEDGLGNSSKLKLSTEEVGVETLFSILNGARKVSFKCGAGDADICLSLPNSLPLAGQTLRVASLSANLIELEWSSDGAGTTSYLHTQASPSTAWTINHNLGIIPSVEVRSAGGVVVIAQITHTSINQTVINFSTATAGTAKLSV